jgi:hypothetical protein
MIALCGPHHDRADAGTYTLPQLRSFKRQPRSKLAIVRGQFDWRRRDIVARVGGTFFVNTPIPVQFGNTPVVQVRRDPDGMSLLSLAMPSTRREPRLLMVDHEWYTTGSAIDFECPPSGRRIHARYANGDSLTIQFTDLSQAQFTTRYGLSPDHIPLDPRSFPICLAEIDMTLADLGIIFGPEATHTRRGSMANSWSLGNHIGLHFPIRHTSDTG